MDFVDPEIEARLAQLEAEEEVRAFRLSMHVCVCVCVVGGEKPRRLHSLTPSLTIHTYKTATTQAWEREQAGSMEEEEDWGLEEEEQALLDAVRAKKKARLPCRVLCRV